MIGGVFNLFFWKHKEETRLQKSSHMWMFWIWKILSKTQLKQQQTLPSYRGSLVLAWLSLCFSSSFERAEYDFFTASENKSEHSVSSSLRFLQKIPVTLLSTCGPHMFLAPKSKDKVKCGQNRVRRSQWCQLYEQRTQKCHQSKCEPFC